MSVVRLTASSSRQPALRLEISTEQFGPDADQVTLVVRAERAPQIHMGQLGHRPPPRYIEVPPPYSATRADCRASEPRLVRASPGQSGPPSTGWVAVGMLHWDV